VTRDEVKEVFKVIKSIYPQFEVNKEKVNIWHKFLQSDNPAVVMRNTEKYVLSNSFPPTIHDIRETKHPSYEAEDLIQKIKKWEGEASGKPKH
jgi:hypothetical protein